MQLRSLSRSKPDHSGAKSRRRTTAISTTPWAQTLLRRRPQLKHCISRQLDRIVLWFERSECCERHGNERFQHIRSWTAGCCWQAPARHLDASEWDGQESCFPAEENQYAQSQERRGSSHRSDRCGSVLQCWWRLCRADKQATASCPIPLPRRTKVTALGLSMCSLISWRRSRRHSPCRVYCGAQFRDAQAVSWVSIGTGQQGLGEGKKRAMWSLPLRWQAEKADLAEVEKILASLDASQAASKSSCVRVASDHECSVADATQVLQNETGTAERQTHSLFQKSSVASLHTTSDLKGFEVATMVRKLAKKEHSGALAQFVSRISVSWSLVHISARIPRDQQVASGGFVWGQPQVVLWWRVVGNHREEAGSRIRCWEAVFWTRSGSCQIQHSRRWDRSTSGGVWGPVEMPVAYGHDACTWAENLRQGQRWSLAGNSGSAEDTPSIIGMLEVIVSVVSPRSWRRFPSHRMRRRLVTKSSRSRTRLPRFPRIRT